MTVPTTLSSVIYTGTGLVSVYAYTWAISQTSDLIAFTINAAGTSIRTLAETTDYTVQGAGIPTGGTVTLTAGNLASGAKLFIASDPEQIQTVLLQQGSGFNPADLMAALDLLTRDVQANRRLVSNSLQYPVAESLNGGNPVLPITSARALKALAFDSVGNPIAIAGATPPSVIVSAFGETLVAAADATAARTVLFDNLFWNPLQYGAVGNGVADDSAAINNTIAAANAAGGGVVLVPEGTYLVSELNLLSGVAIQGVGSGSVFKMASAAQWCLSVNSGSQGSSDPSTNKRNMAVRDLYFYGTSDTDGFSEHKHLLNVNACSDLVVERCWFRGFRGDGIYVGSSNEAATERHNQRITIRTCHFDGINKENRNGISVIDCDGLLVEDCFFTRCTKTTMPGAIDIEPDGNAFAVIRNITVINNKFYDVGGAVATLGMFLPFAQSGLTTPAQHIVFQNNFLDACVQGITLTVAQPPAETDQPHDVLVRGNYMRASGDGLKFFNISGMRVEDNHSENIFSNADWGYSTAGWVNLDVYVTGNRFVKCAYGGGGIVIAVHANRRLTLDGNIFIDCGKSTGASGLILDFIDGTTSYVTLTNNRVRCPSGPQRTTQWVIKDAGATLTPTTNIETGTDLGGLTLTASDFKAYAPGQILTTTFTWDPPSVANNGSTSTTNALTGAAIGDLVQVGFSNDQLLLSLTGYVSSANVVTVLLMNASGGAVNLASGTVTVRLTKV